MGKKSKNKTVGGTRKTTEKVEEGEKINAPPGATVTSIVVAFIPLG